jgi:hypothetical protein
VVLKLARRPQLEREETFLRGKREHDQREALRKGKTHTGIKDEDGRRVASPDSIEKGPAYESKAVTAVGWDLIAFKKSALITSKPLHGLCFIDSERRNKEGKGDIPRSR